MLSALGACDLDFAMSLRNAHLLSAGRAFVKAKISALSYAHLKFVPGNCGFISEISVLSVLLGALYVVAREHSEIHMDHHKKRQQTEYPKPCEHAKNKKYKHHDRLKARKLIYSVPACHKTVHFFSHVL
jgi:hypothetical protein